MLAKDFFLINEIIFILINAIGFWITFLVYLSDKKSKTNQSLSLTIIFLVIWMDLFFVAVFSQFLIPQIYLLVSYLAAKMLFVITGPLVVVFYFFATYFPIEGKRNYLFDKIYVFIWIVLSSISLTTKLVLREVEFDGWRIKVFGNELMGLYLLTAIISIFLIIYLPIKKYPLLTREDKSKVKYFLIGTAIGGSITIFFLALLPFLQGGNYTQEPVFLLMGAYSVLIMIGLYAYAILNKKLFNIRVLLTQLLVVVMGILLLITPFLVNIPWLKTLLSMVFLLFCVFGWLLVRSSIREVRQKEILEQTVEERTKELRASKHELELNKIELEKKVAELEKWYKLTVGRELRMVELKQKIKVLEEDLRKKDDLKKKQIWPV